jgi:hypothetical protein
VVLEAAVGGTDTEAELSISSRHPTLSSLRTDFVTDASSAPGFEHVQWDSSQKVKLHTLDALIETYGEPSYVKIDVEGYELEVLSGLSRPISLISVEYLPGFPHLTGEVLARLSELGDYRFNVVIGERGKFLFPEWTDLDSLNSWLSTQPPRAQSGDLFARLENKKPS